MYTHKKIVSFPFLISRGGERDKPGRHDGETARGLRPGRDGATQRDYTPGQNNGVTQRVTKQGVTTRK
jgi:hypothetical protein